MQAGLLIRESLPVEAVVVDAPLPGHFWLLASSTAESIKFRAALPLRPSNGLLCIRRWKLWWHASKIVQSDGLVPAETYLIVSRLMDGSYITLIPTICGPCSFSLEGAQSLDPSNGDNVLTIACHRSSTFVQVDASPSALDRAVLLSQGAELYPLLEDAWRLVRANALSLPLTPSPSLLADSKPWRRRFERRRGVGPRFADRFGWCTWDSFYTDLSADRVEKGLQSFHQHNIYPRFMILDDGWQDTTVSDRANGFQWGGQLASFRANYKFGPGFERREPVHMAPVTVPIGLKIMTTDSVLRENDLTPSRLRDQEYLRAVRSGGVLGRSNTCNVQESHSLQALVAKVKSDLHVDQFMVWHTLMGFWSGVATDNKQASQHAVDAMAKYRPSLRLPACPSSVQRLCRAADSRMEPFLIPLNMDGIGVVASEEAGAFFDDYHRALKAMGVDGVKVDAQSAVPALQNHEHGAWEITRALHSGLQASVENVFGCGADNYDATLIHCMSHSPHTMLAILASNPYLADLQHRGLPTNCIPVIRGSDDFWPEDAATHCPHVVANAMCSLLVSYAGLQDWDMFQSRLKEGSMLHAVSRAVSGGPVYVSDRPGEQDTFVLSQLVLSNGLVPRCLRNAQPVAATLFEDPQTWSKTPLVLQNINPAGGLVVAGFHVFGSVIDPYCRHIQYAEATWRAPGPTHDVAAAQARVVLGDAGGPWFEDPLFTADLAITCHVSAMDVHEVRMEVNGQQGAVSHNFALDERTLVSRDEYIARRWSDGAVFAVGRAQKVEMVLNRVYDCEVVSFAPKYSPAPRAGGVEEKSQPWVAFVGAANLINSGGAVLAARWVPTDELGVWRVQAELTGVWARHLLALRKGMRLPVVSSIRCRYDADQVLAEDLLELPDNCWLRCGEMSFAAGGDDEMQLVEMVVEPMVELSCDDPARERRLRLATLSFTVTLDLQA